tara:strand:+ start:52 stop:204 length:153 start_codon:yes stop_codon:yes gene_type:complete
VLSGTALYSPRDRTFDLVWEQALAMVLVPVRALVMALAWALAWALVLVKP